MSETPHFAGPDVPSKLACPCCGYLTLDERGIHEICMVCFWEDDGQDDHDADVARGGPNGGLSLTQAREEALANTAGVPLMTTIEQLQDLIGEHPFQ